MSEQTIREYGAAAIASVVGTFLFGAIGFAIVRIGFSVLASRFSLGLEVVLPAALFVGLCSGFGAVVGCWFGLKRVNAAVVGQTIYIQAGWVVLCYAALIGIRVMGDRLNLFVTWAFLIALSALLARRIATWIDK